MSEGRNEEGMKWEVKLTQRKIARGLVLAGWRSMIFPAVAVMVVVILGGIAALSLRQSSSDIAVNLVVVPVFFYMFVIALAYAFSIWIVARITYRRVLRQGGNDVQTYEIRDGKLTYSAAGDTVQLTLANISVVGQYLGVVVLKRDGTRRFYLLFDNADEQMRAVAFLSTK